MKTNFIPFPDACLENFEGLTRVGIFIVMETKLKFGQERNGMKFWGYSHGREYWVTFDQFKSKRQKIKDRYNKLKKKPLNERVLKQGDRRDSDGKIFFQYLIGCKNGELWVDPSDFERRKALARAYSSSWNARNKDLRSARSKDRFKKKMDSLIASGEKKPKQIGRCQEKSNKWKLENKERLKVLASQWRKNNMDRIAKRKREAIRNSPTLLLKSRIRCRTSEAFRVNGYKKNTKTAAMIGCTWDHLKLYIERKFVKGMTWENRHMWHIDHIVPLASARNADKLVRLAHFSNLQPLWKDHNLSKGDKITTCQPELAIQLI